jgi:hypothetical protein
MTGKTQNNGAADPANESSNQSFQDDSDVLMESESEDEIQRFHSARLVAERRRLRRLMRALRAELREERRRSRHRQSHRSDRAIVIRQQLRQRRREARELREEIRAAYTEHVARRGGRQGRMN